MLHNGRDLQSTIPSDLGSTASLPSISRVLRSSGLGIDCGTQVSISRRCHILQCAVLQSRIWTNIGLLENEHPLLQHEGRHLSDFDVDLHLIHRG